jgi:hypothetical protein
MAHDEMMPPILESARIARLPLEEAMMHIDGPLYGLEEPVFGLEHDAHIWRGDDCIRLEYRSPHYAEYAFRNDSTFVVTNRIFAEEQNGISNSIGLALETGSVLLPGCPYPNQASFVDLFERKAKSMRMVAEKATLIIAGKSFTGRVTHYTAPVHYSSFRLCNGCIGLQSEALGPSIEEATEIIKSLRFLNDEHIVERNKMQ